MMDAVFPFQIVLDEDVKEPERCASLVDAVRAPDIWRC